MKKYLALSTLIHLVVFLALNINNQAAIINQFNQNNCSVEILFNQNNNQKNNLGEKGFDPNNYSKAGLDKLKRLTKYNEPPRYPLLALHNNWTGTTSLSFYINKNGNLDNVLIASSSGYRLLDEAALTAANNWQFKPNKDNVVVDFPVRFIIE
jgi:TonB family protein